MRSLLVILTVAFTVMFWRQGVGAEKSQWANAPHKDWYEKQAPTPDTLKQYEIAWKSCCDHGDVCQDCVVYRVQDKPPWKDGWYYLKDGVPQQLPPHIVEYVPWTPTGKPVLFVAPHASGKMKIGDPVCLKSPAGGV